MGATQLSFIPSSIKLTPYSNVRSAEEELAPANKAYTRIGKVANDLILDVSSGKPLDLEQVNTVIPDVVSSMIRNPDALMWITRLRKQDDVTYGHGLQVAVYLIVLGRHLGLLKDYLERLGTAGLLLDLGKIRLPQEVLQKNGHLSAKEFDIIKSHVRLSLDIADTIPNLHPDIRAGIAQHHERVNGSGYPEKLSRNQISLFSCMTGIVDSFVALTNPRPYSEAMPTHEALTSMKNWGGKFYHSDLVEQFTQAIGIFPIGSMVELSSGEVSVIISHSKTNRLKPCVLVISDADKNPLPQPVILDLSNQPQETDEPPPYILRGLPTNAYKLDAGEHYLTWPTTARRLKTKPLPKR